MNHMNVDVRHTQKLRFYVTGITLAGAAMVSLFLVQLAVWLLSGNNPSQLELSTDTARYVPHALLTFGCGLCLMYAIVGALITGLTKREVLHPCFMCLFSLAVPASMVGLGLTWMNYTTYATWLMLGTVLFLALTSHFARTQHETHTPT